MVIYQPENVKGFQDYLPPESQKRAKIKAIIEKYFKLYGFLPVETSTIEFDELMRSDSIDDEDEAVSDRFRLRDKGNRSLALRYEFTFQLARIFKLNPNLKLPFKRYQIGPVFRDEPTTSNRFREFTQCDADIIGDSSIGADAECLAMFSDILSELKIKSEIQINNRRLLNAIIESVQIQNKTAVIREIDKLDKIGEDIVKTNLRKHADMNQIMALFKILDKPLDFFIDNLFDGSSELKELVEKLKAYGFKVKFNPKMIRGLSYYTGNIFEIKIEGQKETIAGGGRYDNSVGKFINKITPAVGISFGLERVMQLAIVQIDNTKAVLISIDKDKETLKIAKNFRKEGISCITTFDKIGKALEYANSYQIPYAVFIGEDEIKQKKLKLRDMKTGEEKLLAEKSIISKLKKG